MKNFIDKKIKEFEKQDKKFQISFELNQQAMKYEQQKKKELAIEYYEKAVSAQFNGSHPYQQLTKIYLQQKRYEREQAYRRFDRKHLKKSPDLLQSGD